MVSKIKLLALGWAAAALLGPAQAAVVLLDFETIGKAAPLAGTPVGNAFVSDGITFSANAVANHNGQPSGNLVPPPPRAAADNNFGFVRNAADSSGTAGDFTVQFAAGRSYRDISLEWAAADSFQVTLFDGLGGSLSTSGLNGSNWGRGWSVLDLSDAFGDHRRIDSISFSGARKRFAIDNLRLNEGTAGGTVPEPAGLGLVALALAGVGLAAQRSRKV